jgi:hypothetical protein
MPSQVYDCKKVEEIIKFSLESSKGDYKLPVALWGLAGVGKTEFVKQVAESLGYNLVVVHLATQGDICDLIGMPKTSEFKDAEGNVIGSATVWSCPEWLFKALENAKATGKPNLFFLDEFNRGNRFVLAAMLPFLIEGKLHTHKINTDDAIICAMNPPTDNYEVNTISDEALLNRVAHCVFKPTNDEYIKYLQKSGMDNVTINVLKKNPEFMTIKNFNLDFDIVPSRRSIDHVMKVIGKKSSEWINKHGSYVIQAYLGEKFSDEWMSEFSMRNNSLTIDMLIDYDNNKDIITQALTTQIDGITTERADILSKLIESIKLWIDDRKDTLSVDDIQWMFKFFDNPIVPTDACATILRGNPFFREKILTDYAFNRQIFSFLNKKGIIIEPNIIKEWNRI